MKSPPSLHFLQTLTLSLLLLVLLGWLLNIGQTLLMPILIALISVYVLVAAAERLGRLPVFRHFSEWLRRLLVLLLFFGALTALVGMVIATGEKLLATAPKYQANLEQMLNRLAAAFNLGNQPDWKALYAATFGKINLQKLLADVLGSVGSLLGTAGMVAIYAAFLLGERGGFAHKLSVAFPAESALRLQQVIGEVNRKIGTYLAAKTVINVQLGLLSWLVMWVFGVDFALFWALLIGLLNYIPYVGSILGVVFPVLLSLAQFASPALTFWLALWLTAAQFAIGNIVEPRIIGKQVNLSPFVVMVALSLWSALWGVAGAILAIPLTSMLAIICSVSPSTRPFAVLLADNVSDFVATQPAPETSVQTKE